MVCENAATRRKEMYVRGGGRRGGARSMWDVGRGGKNCVENGQILPFYEEIGKKDSGSFAFFFIKKIFLRITDAYALFLSIEFIFLAFFLALQKVHLLVEYQNRSCFKVQNQKTNTS